MASIAPSGLKARAVTALVWRARVAISAFLTTFQSVTEASLLPEARVLPSGLKARVVMAPRCPLSLSIGRPVVASQSETALPSPPVARILPSGEIARARTGPAGSRSRPMRVRVVASQRVTPADSLAVATRLPSGENASASIGSRWAITRFSIASGCDRPIEAVNGFAVIASQSRTEASPPTVTIVFPSGPNARPQIRPRWPRIFVLAVGAGIGCCGWFGSVGGNGKKATEPGVVRLAARSETAAAT